MSADMTIGGVVYISSKRASEITGYTQDYVGQLARSGKVMGQRVGGLWYVVADSVLGHKKIAETYIPVPPQMVENPSIQASTEVPSVSLDGKTYVTAAQAAKMTTYHQDYIGQLARAGKILSKQVGKRWYVDIEALKAHKKEKDSLLAAVQIESVGLSKAQVSPIDERKEEAPDVGLHYKYKVDEKPLLPVMEVGKPVVSMSDSSSQTLPAERNIPIRIVRASSPVSQREYQSEITHKKAGRMTRISIFLKLFSVFAVVALVFITFNINLSYIPLNVIKVPLSPAFLSQIEVPKDLLETIEVPEAIQRIFLREITYTRGE